MVGALVGLASAGGPAVSGSESWIDLTTPPRDSAEAERVRIWVPLMQQSRSRVTIDILNDSNQVVRRLLNRLLDGGYYNFYWDKKDDTGGRVPEGEYTYVVENLGEKRKGRLTVRYRHWERESWVRPVAERWSAAFELELEQDSALVSVYVFNRRGKLIDSMVVDSLMDSGQHEFDWRPEKWFPRGLYTAEIRVGDYTHTVQFGYRPR